MLQNIYLELQSDNCSTVYTQWYNSFAKVVLSIISIVSNFVSLVATVTIKAECFDCLYICANSM